VGLLLKIPASPPALQLPGEPQDTVVESWKNERRRLAILFAFPQAPFVSLTANVRGSLSDPYLPTAVQLPGAVHDTEATLASPPLLFHQASSAPRIMRSLPMPKRSQPRLESR